MTLEERIENLERENRWLKRIGVAAVILVAACLVAALNPGVRAQTKAVPQLVEAQSFVLKDAKGRVRAEFGVRGKDGEVVFLELRDIDGKPAVLLAADKIGTSLGLLSAGQNLEEGTFEGAFLTADQRGPSLRLRGTMTAALSAQKNEAGLDLVDGKGNTRAWLDVSDHTELALHDESGKSRAIVSVEKNGDPHVDLTNGSDLTDASGRAALTILKDSGPTFWLDSGDGNQRVSLSSSASDGASLKISDTQGFSTSIGNTGLVTPSTGETHRTSAASIRMFNDKGNVIWGAPPQ